MFDFSSITPQGTDFNEKYQNWPISIDDMTLSFVARNFAAVLSRGGELTQAP